jgi:ABC-type transport system involved in multi-copper enzyme maturation permease subunit
VTPASAHRQPSLLFSTARIFDLSLGQMLWSRRSVFLGLLVGGPVVLAVAVRLVLALFAVGGNVNRARVPGDVVFGMMMWLLYVRFIVPVLGVFYGTAFIADEVDDRTITYLFTRPIPRRAVLFGKYLAYLVCSALLVLPSAMLVFFLIVPTGGGSIAQAFPALLSDLGMLAIGLAAYGAVFAFVGTRVQRPLLIGLLFALGWEPTVLVVPGYLKRLSVAYYLQALVVHDVPQDSGPLVILQAFRESPSLAVALMALAVIVVAALWLAGRVVERREYVLEQ